MIYFTIILSLYNAVIQCCSIVDYKSVMSCTTKSGKCQLYNCSDRLGLLFVVKSFSLIILGM